MTDINLQHKHRLDGEKIFRMYYSEMGSARSIMKVVRQIGNNPNTNLPYYPMAIWFTIYKWSLDNLDASYEIFCSAMRDEGKYHTKSEWETFVLKKCATYAKNNQRRLSGWQKRASKRSPMTQG
jgi:hypothetical protein